MEIGKARSTGFFFIKSVSGDDITFLQALPGYSSIDRTDDQYRYGFNAKYNVGNFQFFAQMMSGIDGTLKREGIQIQPSYYIPTNWKYLKGFRPVYQFSTLDVSLENNSTDARTWDREQHIIALIAEFTKVVQLRAEYSINREETGHATIDDVNNNEFLLHLHLNY